MIGIISIAIFIFIMVKIKKIVLYAIERQVRIDKSLSSISKSLENLDNKTEKGNK